MTAIRQWQRAAHELAREKGEHSVVCDQCRGDRGHCAKCCGVRRVEVDHKSPTRLASRLALIHLEISRAVECVVEVGQRMRVHFKHTGDLNTVPHFVEPNEDPCWTHSAALLLISRGYQPQGFPIALAGMFLRLCDLADGLGIVLKDWRDGPARAVALSTEQTLEMLNALHYDVSVARAWDSIMLDDAYGTLRNIADAHDIDLLASAELLYAYEARTKR